MLNTFNYLAILMAFSIEEINGLQRRFALCAKLQEE
jgi:hypothetical protein